ncbi:MarR family winged helix-turn-helix transcriptional regulator [Actinophytocola sp.]|uniref:MarR family winged helix-turn-helix transcriptional regulator n=1 Tax=Actinophytocola sp. TaxID=1872138 RepID=UPI002D807221|nr:MarR family transcriptional regulator [Actinophytocola sp.]HET9141278.1 MarR family transcriptional regulator [Actinophytocola sp.]
MGAARDLMYLLAQASHVLTTELTAGLEGLGISPRHYCVLRHAGEGEELTQIRLAELCGLDKTTMVVTVDELERAGLAERSPSATDRRARIIRVTANGRRMVAEAESVVDRIYADVLGALPARNREVFLDSLARLVESRLSTPVRCDRTVRRRA